MKLVQRGNKQLRINDLALDSMLKAGYVEIDEKTGKPINVPEKDDPEALKKEIKSLKKENKALKEELEALIKAENKKAE